MSKAKTIFFGIVFTVLATVFLVLAAEVALFVGNKLFKIQRLSVLDENYVEVASEKIYPKYPNDYLKIAIFGGSAARGYNSERSFGDMLPIVLQGNLNGNKKIFIRNYAEDGRPFHRYGSELAVAAAARYDVLIIYAGTNEPLNYYDDIRYFVKPEFKKEIDLSKTPDIAAIDRLIEGRSENPVEDFFGRRSRLYSVAKRFTAKFASQMSMANGTKPVNKFRNARFNAFESKAIIPKTEQTKLAQAFAGDLKRVADEAKKYGAKVLLLPETPEELFSPTCSVLSESLAPALRASIQTSIKKAEHLYKTNQPTQATAILRDILQKTPDLAKALHLQGMIAFDSKRWPEAWKSLRAAIDNDCFPMRTLTSMHNAMYSVVGQHENAKIIDVLNEFRKLRIKGFTAQELYSDVVHPTMLGHYALALVAAKGLDQTGVSRVGESLDHKLADRLREAFQDIPTQLRVTNAERANAAFMQARWNLSFAFRAGNSEQYQEWARAHLHEYIKLVGESAEETSDAYLYLGLSYAIGRDYEQALRWLNEAHRRSSGRISHRYLNDVMATGDGVRSILEEASIEFDSKANKFHKR